MWEKAGGSAAYNQLDVEACFLEIVPIKWRPAILRLHQGHLEAMKLPPPGAVFTVLWFGGHFLQFSGRRELPGFKASWHLYRLITGSQLNLSSAWHT